MIDPNEEMRPVDLGLTELECEFLAGAISQWGGPASVSDDVARLSRFADTEAMREGLRRIYGQLTRQSPMTRRDWSRAMVAAELVFGSDTYGVGVEWEIVTGRDVAWTDDCESLATLRELQRKLVAVSPPRFDRHNS